MASAFDRSRARLLYESSSGRSVFSGARRAFFAEPGCRLFVWLDSLALFLFFVVDERVSIVTPGDVGVYDRRLDVMKSNIERK